MRTFTRREEEKNAFIKPCANVTDSVVQEMQELVEEKRESKILKRKMEALDKAMTASPGASSSKVSKVQQSLPVMLKNKKAVDESLSIVQRFHLTLPTTFTSNGRKNT